MSDDEESLSSFVLRHYRKLVTERHPGMVGVWPVLSGYNVKVGGFGDHTILIFESTGAEGFVTSIGIGDLTPAHVGATEITSENVDRVRARLEGQFALRPRDAVIIYHGKHGLPVRELETAIRKHEHAMGLTPMKIFLSHKGTDKPLVRDFEKTLRLLGFDPWLDEDAMAAGAELERALLQGFADSCAVVFFVTRNYVDENFLASEIDYAIAERRKKNDKFSIITLALDEAGEKNIPALLRRYVWKTPSTHLEALREIIKALPIKVGDVYWK